MIEFQDICKRRPLFAYCEALNSGVQDKVNLITPWIISRDSGTIIDFGCGTGKLAAILSKQYPECHVLGIDLSMPMVTLAQQIYGDRHSNLNFRWGSTHLLEPKMAQTIILSSVLHEVYSYANDSLKVISNLFESAWNSLFPGGRIIIRDFIQPELPNTDVILKHRSSDIWVGHDFESFQKNFSRKLSLDSVDICNQWHLYVTDLGSAYEYIHRKDFHEMWEIELLERYGFWSMDVAQNLLHKTGFSLICCQRLYNNWLLNHSLVGRVELLELRHCEPMGLPQSQVLLVAEKQ